MTHFEEPIKLGELSVHVPHFPGAQIVVEERKITINYPEDRWISVKDKLPNRLEGGLFLVTSGTEVGVAYWEDMDFVGGEPQELYNENITHWMHMPEAPKEKE